MAKNVYYDSARNYEIVDLSGTKTLAQIEAQFGPGPYQQISCAKGEEHYYDGTTLKKKKALKAISL